MHAQPFLPPVLWFVEKCKDPISLLFFFFFTILSSSCCSALGLRMKTGEKPHRKRNLTGIIFVSSFFGGRGVRWLQCCNSLNLITSSKHTHFSLLFVMQRPRYWNSSMTKLPIIAISQSHMTHLAPFLSVDFTLRNPDSVKNEQPIKVQKKHTEIYPQDHE